jgi:hypothetical protein
MKKYMIGYSFEILREILKLLDFVLKTFLLTLYTVHTLFYLNILSSYSSKEMFVHKLLYMCYLHKSMM